MILPFIDLPIDFKLYFSDLYTFTVTTMALLGPIDIQYCTKMENMVSGRDGQTI